MMEATARKLRRLFLHNFGWKAGSLGLAILLWFAVVGEPELVTIQAADVYFENLAPGLVLTTDVPRVQLELSGPSAVLSRENLSTVKILLDLSRVTVPGAQTISISEADVARPDGVQFKSAVPSRLFLEFDRRTTKRVPVRIELSGNPGAGYRVTKQQVSPPMVEISGPAMRVQAMQSAQTDTVDISGLTRSVDLRVNAYVTDPLVQLTSPPLVAVSVTIEKGSGQSLP
jgi:hypothetical protein